MSTITPPPIIAPPPTLPYATPTDLAIPPGWTNPHTFTLDPALRSQYLRLLLLFLTAMRLLFFTVTLAVAALLLHEDLLTLGLLACVLLVMSVVGTTRTLLKNRRSWPTYRLLLADQGLIARSLTTPLTRIDAADIRSISRTWDGYKLTLRSGRHLSLSKRLRDPHLLEARLQHFHPIDPGHGRLGALLFIASSWLASLLTIALALVGMTSTTPATVLTCALLALPLVLFITLRIHRIKGLPLRTRIITFIQLLLPLLVLAHYLLLHFSP